MSWQAARIVHLTAIPQILQYLEITIWLQERMLNRFVHWTAENCQFTLRTTGVKGDVHCTSKAFLYGWPWTFIWPADVTKTSIPSSTLSDPMVLTPTPSNLMERHTVFHLFSGKWCVARRHTISNPVYCIHWSGMSLEGHVCQLPLLCGWPCSTSSIRTCTQKNVESLF